MNFKIRKYHKDKIKEKHIYRQTDGNGNFSAGAYAEGVSSLETIYIKIWTLLNIEYELDTAC